MGIVQSQALWATNAEFLNDAQELQFGRGRALDALLKQADELSPDSGAFDANTSRATVMRGAAHHLGRGCSAWSANITSSTSPVSAKRATY
jgi:hypothetical protein